MKRIKILVENLLNPALNLMNKIKTRLTKESGISVSLKQSVILNATAVENTIKEIKELLNEFKSTESTVVDNKDKSVHIVK